jgi:hypothetical protein
LEKLELEKYYGKKLKEIWEPTPREMLENQIKKNKGTKRRWPEKRKIRKVWRKLSNRKIDWTLFLYEYIKTKDRKEYINSMKKSVRQYIIERKENVRLMSEDQLINWGAWYYEKVDEI